ncbi:MAG: FHA domain-containing protein [Aggregatilineales bacterium]
MEDISAVFKVIGPALDRNTITVDRAGIYAGRTSNNDLPLPDKQISRQHFRILWRDGNFWVEDLDSMNGVFLNGARIDSQIPMPLSVGDSLRAGPFVLTLERVVRPALPTAPDSGGREHQSNGNLNSLRQEVPIRPGVIEASPATVYSSIPVSRPSISPLQLDAMMPRIKPRADRYPDGIEGIPKDRSTWLQYLPGIFADPSLDQTEFMGRYLLIFESLLSPIVWMVDNFDLYLSPETAPEVWLQWMASWFDVELLHLIPEERQREIMKQMGWLYLRRGTRTGMERLLELYFGVSPEILENVDGACRFVVRLPLTRSDVENAHEIAERIIASQTPAFATFTIDVT